MKTFKEVFLEIQEEQNNGAMISRTQMARRFLECEDESKLPKYKDFYTACIWLSTLADGLIQADEDFIRESRKVVEKINAEA